MTEIEGWTWCPVLERPVKDTEGHRPAASRLCNGTPHHKLLLGEIDCVVCRNTGLAYDETEHRMVPCGGIYCKVLP